MRQLVLDTETTGLEVEKGHRIIEVGCVELVNRRRTSHNYQEFFNPDREIDAAAEEVHGISREMLADKRRFAEFADEFLEFLGGAEIVIHNADFDLGFLNNELRLAGYGTSIQEHCSVIDTLPLARQMHPGQRNSLDALCKRYHVDNSGREYHGALLDAQLLADVYLAMTGGQGSLSFEAQNREKSNSRSKPTTVDREGLALVISAANSDDLVAHDDFLALLDEAAPHGALWRRLDS